MRRCAISHSAAPQEGPVLERSSPLPASDPDDRLVAEIDQLRAELHACEARYRALVEQAPDAVLLSDLAGRLVSVNPAGLAMLGFAADHGPALIGRALSEFIDPEELRAHPVAVDRLPVGRIHSRRRLLVRSDRSRFAAATSARLLPDGRTIQIVVRDVSEYDRMLEALRLETERLDVLQTVTVAANESRTLSQALRRCLPILCKAGGWTVGHVYRPHLRGWLQLVSTAIWYTADPVATAELRTRSYAAVIVPGRGLVGRAVANGGPEWAQDLGALPGFVRAEAALRSGLVSALAFPVESNGIVVAAIEFYAPEPRERDESFLQLLAHACTILGPVAERQQSRLALARARRESDDLIRSLACALVAVDGRGEISHCNESALRLFGWKRNVSKSSYLGLPLPPPLESLRASISRCLAERVEIDVEPIRLAGRDGGAVCLDISLRPLPERGGEPPGALLVATDVSEIERLQSSVATSHRLESIGQLAGGIAHELNTPMQYVGDNVQFLDRAFADLVRVVERGVAGAPDVDLKFLLDEIPKALSDSREGVEQVDHIVRAMKELSDHDSGARVPTHLNELVQSVLTVSRNVWKFLADVQFDPCPDLPPVPCHPGPLSRALANLVVNASEAIADVARASGKKGMIRVQTLNDGDWAELRISDTGPGIPDPVRARVFEPFFSTKNSGTATGQGLAITQSVIVDGHGGTVRFETAIGRGTTFFVRLPLTPASDEAAAR
jgi:PAS domain S-box-containing protein